MYVWMDRKIDSIVQGSSLTLRAVTQAFRAQAKLDIARRAIKELWNLCSLKLKSMNPDAPKAELYDCSGWHTTPAVVSPNRHHVDPSQLQGSIH